MEVERRHVEVMCLLTRAMCLPGSTKEYRNTQNESNNRAGAAGRYIKHTYISLDIALD